MSDEYDFDSITPGYWTDDSHRVITEHGLSIAHCYGRGGLSAADSVKEIRANAMLMGASKEMADDMSMCVEWLEAGDLTDKKACYWIERFQRTLKDAGIYKG